MEAAATRQAETRRQRCRKFHIEIEWPVFGRLMRDSDRRKRGAQLGHDRRIIGQDVLGRGLQPQGERSSETRRWIELPWRFVTRRFRRELLRGDAAPPRVHPRRQSGALALL